MQDQTKSPVTEIHSMDEFKAIIMDTSDTVHVIDFFTTWCGPCKRISPEIEKMACSESYKSVRFYKIDADQDQLQAAVSACKVEAFPTFCFFSGGKILEKTEGGPSSKISKIIDTLLQQKN